MSALDNAAANHEPRSTKKSLDYDRDLLVTLRGEMGQDDEDDDERCVHGFRLGDYCEECKVDGEADATDAAHEAGLS